MTFLKLLEEMTETFKRKNADYAGQLAGGTYANFEYAAKVAEPFTDPVDRVFAVMIGIKLARLANLKRPDVQAKNESVGDSQLDLANYATIWAAWEKDRK